MGKPGVRLTDILMRDFLSAADGDQQFALAKTIADKTIGVQQFFEWESPPEDV